MREIPLIGLLALLMLVASCGNKEQQREERVVKVNIMEISVGSAESMHEYAGTIEEAFTSQLSFGSSGRITAIYVKEGQRVQKGQLLAKIDNSNASNSYKAAKATLDQAQDGYDRAKQVYEAGSLPEVKWTEIQTQLNQAQSLAEIAKKNLDDCELRAPASGTIGDRTIEVGTSVTPFQPVMKLIGLDGLFVKTSIPEGDINEVAVGSNAFVIVSALGNKELEGIVEERNPSADPLSHSYLIRIRIKGNTKDLLPGMVCRVQMANKQEIAKEQSEFFEVPNRAVQIDNQGKRYVWVVENECAVQRYVTISDLTNNGVQIAEGLHLGDKVIVDGMLKVATGTKVKYN